MVLCCPHVLGIAAVWGLGWAQVLLPSSFGSFLLAPQHHLLDSLCSPPGDGSGVGLGCGVGLIQRVVLGYCPLKLSPVSVLLGLGTRVPGLALLFSMRLAGQKVRSRVSQEI